MHVTHSTSEIIVGSIAVAVVLVFVFGLLQIFDRIFAPKIAAPADEDAEHFSHVKRAVKQLPDGSWVAAKIAWEPCAPPMAPNDVEPHFPLDKKHRAGCARCQDEYRRSARMPHASN